MSADPIALASSTISQLPICGQTCIAKLPEWSVPLTSAALTGVCNNLQADLNQFTLLPVGCTALGVNVTAVQIPNVGGSPSAAVTTTAAAAAVTTAAVTTTKSEAFKALALGAVSIAAVLMF
ncbi:hypothetical protein BCR33DRAFT_711671 [Rhizoclosmatium globosum]|uniref:Uncharacterized protein n=1 Tax=Rhizoclosmatium globosum TaxID=329046 RepID=A0A1Y2CZ63_9FUNG|nr:hypothetical protein BCR33DRAFT_711671 [Rhizoclosmatium globosum]|eukprot:ORY52342.1 hypothetical protein BCR33DRAFT_711671 [Rhizoclosmatium globosum]